MMCYLQERFSLIGLKSKIIQSSSLFFLKQNGVKGVEVEESCVGIDLAYISKLVILIHSVSLILRISISYVKKPFTNVII